MTTTIIDEPIQQDELAGKLTDLVVGHRIVSVEGDTLTLDNGTSIELTGSQDCCAYGSVDLGALADSQNIVTAVKSEGGDAGYPSTAQVFILTDAGPALTIDQEWNESNGYYFYGLHLTVKAVAA